MSSKKLAFMFLKNYKKETQLLFFYNFLKTYCFQIISFSQPFNSLPRLFNKFFLLKKSYMSSF